MYTDAKADSMGMCLSLPVQSYFGYSHSGWLKANFKTLPSEC